MAAASARPSGSVVAPEQGFVPKGAADLIPRASPASSPTLRAPASLGFQGLTLAAFAVLRSRRRRKSVGLCLTGKAMGRQTTSKAYANGLPEPAKFPTELAVVISIGYEFGRFSLNQQALGSSPTAPTNEFNDIWQSIAISLMIRPWADPSAAFQDGRDSKRSRPKLSHPRPEKRQAGLGNGQNAQPVTTSTPAINNDQATTGWQAIRHALVGA